MIDAAYFFSQFLGEAFHDREGAENEIRIHRRDSGQSSTTFLSG